MDYFKPEKKRYCSLPILHQDLRDFYIELRDNRWTEDEVPYDEDLKDWAKLNDNTKHFLKHVLGFFASSDIIVLDNLALNMMESVPYLEASHFYAEQLTNENAHSDTYARLIETLITDESEKQKLFNAIEEIPVVKKKAGWALKWIENGDPVDKLIAFTIVEGLLFSGSFCAIYFMNNQQKLPALSMANRFIARDEQLHRDFAIHLYNNYVLPEAKKSNETIKNIINEALAVESEFITEALPVSLIGMNSDLMKQYLRYVANDLYLLLTRDSVPLYTDKNPFPFLESLALNNKTNFFERRVDVYNTAVTGDIQLTENF
jgi:ribonucleoside-diphosphate reductase beta chain